MDRTSKLGNMAKDNAPRFRGALSCADVPSVFAVVVTHNRSKELAMCLDALCAQTVPLARTIVVDNASTDDTGLVVQSYPSVDYIRFPENRGGAAGFAEGMRLACNQNCDWIWVMDDDAVPAKDALEHLLSVCEIVKDQNVACIASAVVARDMTLDLMHRRYVRDSFALFREVPVSEANYSSRFFHVDAVSFVGAMFRVNSVVTAGLPLAELFYQYDDTEYSLRLRSKGFRLIVIPASRVLHLGSRGQVSGPTEPSYRKLYYSYRNQAFVYRKYSRNVVQLGSYCVRRLLRPMLSTIVKHRDWRGARIILIAAFDGLTGRLGPRADRFAPKA